MQYNSDCNYVFQVLVEIEDCIIHIVSPNRLTRDRRLSKAPLLCSRAKA